MCQDDLRQKEKLTENPNFFPLGPYLGMPQNLVMDCFSSDHFLAPISISEKD